jgi:hypothetical protein
VRFGVAGCPVGSSHKYVSDEVAGFSPAVAPDRRGCAQSLRPQNRLTINAVTLKDHCLNIIFQL